MTLFQRNTMDSYRGRVFGALGAAQGLAVLVGTVAAGWLGEAIGIVPVLAVQGAGCCRGPGGSRLAAAIAWPTATGPWSGPACPDTSIA